MAFNLIAGSYLSDLQMPEKVEMDTDKRKELSEDEKKEEDQIKSVKKRKKRKNRSMCSDEEEQPGPSSGLTEGQRKKSRKICFCKSLSAFAFLL